MKNRIIYGIPGSGKTTSYFDPEIKAIKSKTIAISFESKRIDGFKTFEISDPNLDFEYVFSHNKIILKSNNNSDMYWNNTGLERVLEYLLENIDNFEENVFLAIDEFHRFNLSKEFNHNGSLLLNLLKLEKLHTLFILQTLADLSQLYENEYTEIIQLNDIICTKQLDEYSGELRVRFPKSLHKYLKEEADKEGISLNLYIIYTLTKTIK